MSRSSGQYLQSRQTDHSQDRYASPYLRPQSSEKFKRSNSGAGYSVNNRPVYNILTGEQDGQTQSSSKNRPSSASATNRTRATTYITPNDYGNTSAKPAYSWLAAEKATSSGINSNYQEKAKPDTSNNVLNSTGYARPKSAGTTRQTPVIRQTENPTKALIAQYAAENRQQSERRISASSNTISSAAAAYEKSRDVTYARDLNKEAQELNNLTASASYRTRTSGIQPIGFQPKGEHWTTSYKFSYGVGGNNPPNGSNNNINNSGSSPSGPSGTSNQVNSDQNNGNSATAGMMGHTVGSGLPHEKLLASKPQYTTNTASSGQNTKQPSSNTGANNAAATQGAPPTRAAKEAATASGMNVNTGSEMLAYEKNEGNRHTPIASARMRAAMAHGATTATTAGADTNTMKLVNPSTAYGMGAGGGGGGLMNGNSIGVGFRGLGLADTGRSNGQTDREDEEDMMDGEGGGGVEDPMEGVVDNDDDEMDGKRVSDSRSHPEITTPSQSLEFGSSDVRGNSFSSINDRLLAGTIGLSTIPNEYCSLNEAQDLKKLLFSGRTAPGAVANNAGAMDMYMVGKVVGVGSYGKVRAAWHRLTGAKVAIKTYDKTKMKDPAHWKRVQSEIKIMEQVSHPRIARMYEAVETTKRMHIIMECIDGGNLCSYVKAKRRLSEEESKRIFFQLLQAMEYLHTLNFVHRDIKLENVLFGDTKDIKLIDFGFSTVHQQGKRLRVFCGTPSYMAPEIVKRTEYEGKPTDMWSMGILLYALLCGCFPFRARTYPDLYRRIARGYFTIPEDLSGQVRDLLHQLLALDPSSRTTAANAIRHPWLQTQLIHAPDLLRLKAENPLLISDRAGDDLDDQVLTEMTQYGITREDVIRQISNKLHSSLTTLYYLLRFKIVSSRRISALNPLSKVRTGTNFNQVPVVKRPPSTTGAYVVANAALLAGGSNPNGTSSTKNDNIPVQILQGALNGARPRSASAGRMGSSAHNRPRSATAARLGVRG